MEHCSTQMREIMDRRRMVIGAKIYIYNNGSSLGKTVENRAFFKTKIPGHITHHLKELDELIILTIDVKVIGSSFL